LKALAQKVQFGLWVHLEGTGVIFVKVIGSRSRSQEQKNRETPYSRNVKLRSAMTPVL